ncbi:MAG: hypothetical protein IPP15_19255 [Saprospiraceae bacterium]|uniref:Uncharacterized protein n=1 Tax=Candidatus Opimibacter skivensis TaxID=2982028 RepID=A0A9D7XPG6_9BACT|nr:hypothetical protein [Candidatus Opimibacter skivensis]
MSDTKINFPSIESIWSFIKIIMPSFAYSALFVYLLQMIFERLVNLSTIVLILIIIGAWGISYILQNYFNNKSEKPRSSVSRMAAIRNSLDPYEPFILIFPVLGALGFTFEGSRIISNTQAIIDFSSYSNKTLDVFVFLTWILLSLWIFIVFRFTKKVEVKNILRLEEVVASIQKLPSKNLIPQYEQFYEQLIDTINSKKYNPKSTDKIVLVSAIQLIIGQMIEVVKYFSPYDDKSEKIAGNVMLLINTSTSKDIANFLFDRLSFKTDDAIHELLGILVLPNELIYQSNTNDKYLAPLYLPVPNQAEENDSIRALPGAPWAALRSYSLYNDVKYIDNDLSSMSQRARNKITLYFNSGEGSFIKSFISIRISNNPNAPIGVLNFDSRHENIIQDPTTVPTLLAFIKPLSMILSPFVEQFSKLYVAELKLEAENQSSTAL